MYLLKLFFRISQTCVALMCLNSKVLAQDLENLRHSKTNQYSMDFYILEEPNQKVPKDTLEYYWFKSQQVYHTQGGAAGSLLHGGFSKFYTNGQLAEQGEFKFGLKNGKWFSWYSNGKIKAVHHYKMGVLSGKFYQMNEGGEVINAGKYKKGIQKEEKVKLEKEPKEKREVFSKLFKKDEEKEVVNEPEDEKSKMFKFKRTEEEKEEKKRAKEKQKEEKKLKKEN